MIVKFINLIYLLSFIFIYFYNFVELTSYYKHKVLRTIFFGFPKK